VWNRRKRAGHRRREIIIHVALQLIEARGSQASGVRPAIPPAAE
jgi:hypothetical protein